MPPNRTLSSPSLPSNAPGTVLLETTNLVIRRWAPSDAPALAAAANHPSITHNLRDRFPMPYTLSDAEGYLDNYVVSPEAYPSALAILLKPTNPDHATASPSSSPAAAAAAAAASSSSEPQQQQQQPLLIGGAGLESKGDVYYRTWELGYWFTPSAWGKGVRRGAVEKDGEVLDECIWGILRSDVERLGTWLEQ
ncbi:acyl-CoA N-acyltransferase [Trichoderma novae-zelandiae]